MDKILFKNKKAKYASGFFISLLIIIGAAYWGYNLLQKRVAERFLRIADDEFYQSVMAVNKLSTDQLISFENSLDNLIGKISGEKDISDNALKVINQAKNLQENIEPTIYVQSSHILLMYYYKEALDTVNKYADYINYRLKLANEIKSMYASADKIINSETACREDNIGRTISCLSDIKKSVNNSLYKVKDVMAPKGMAEFEASVSQYAKVITENCDKLIRAAQTEQNIEYENILKISRENIPVYPDTLKAADISYFNQLHGDFIKLMDTVLMVQAELEKTGNYLGIFVMNLPPLEW